MRTYLGIALTTTLGFIAIACSSTEAVVVAPASDAGAGNGVVIPDAAAPPADSGGMMNGGDAASVSDAAILPDGAFAADGGMSNEAGPGGNTSSLACGSAQCSIPAQVCCVSGGGNGAGGGVFAYACVMGASCPMAMGNNNPPTALKCSSSANCNAGTVCCVKQNGQDTESSCQVTCGNNDAQLCDPAAASSGCAAGVMCSAANIGDWGLPRSFATCGGVGN
jgi:hypothetical protein